MWKKEGKDQNDCRNNGWDHLAEMKASFREAAAENSGNDHRAHTEIQALSAREHGLVVREKLPGFSIREFRDQSIILGDN